MGYLLLANATMVVHFAFLAYFAFGGFLAWRRAWPLVPHALAVGWGVLALSRPTTCPLTVVQDWARLHAGEAALPGGFIDHYLKGVVYPAQYTDAVLGAAAVVIVVSWVVAYLRHRARHRDDISAVSMTRPR